MMLRFWESSNLANKLMDLVIPTFVCNEINNNPMRISDIWSSVAISFFPIVYSFDPMKIQWIHRITRVFPTLHALTGRFQWKTINGNHNKHEATSENRKEILLVSIEFYNLAS